MSKLNVRKGDTVQVISGKDRGLTGKVIEVYPESDRLIVEGVNRIKKHTRVGQNARGAKTGGIVTTEAPIHVSNVMVVDPEDGRPTRIGLPSGEGREAAAGWLHLRKRAQRAHFQAHREGPVMSAATTTLPRLKARYREEIIPELRSEFDLANIMQVPTVTKVVVNMGVGEAARDSKLIEGAIRDLTEITGQKPQVTRSRKSIAQFKLREGQPIGAHVTLRGDRMWEFLDRLLSIALPRIRDFRGLSPKQFDGHGNYTFGLTEQSVFHEIDQDKIDRTRGMDITVVTTAPNDDEGRALLRLLGFPFKEA